MDTRILAVLKAVAYGGLCYDDCNGSCPFGEVCTADDIMQRYGSPLHDPACPVTLARQVLSEMGTPILLYLVKWEFYHGTSHDWQPASPSYQLACDEAEVRAAFPEETDLAQRRRQLRRNVRITCLGEALDLLKAGN